jgi:hypothetical protein
MGSTMKNHSTRATARTGPNPLLGLLLALVLIYHFLWNLLVPAHELPLRMEQVLTMTADLGMFVGLFAFRRVIPTPLFWIAFIAGIGLGAFRLSKYGWWTGHLVFALASAVSGCVG